MTKAEACAARVFRGRILRIGLVGGWLLAVALWMGVDMRYAATSGPLLEGPVRWPTGIEGLRTPGRPTLLLFAHPRCACTRVTLDELEAVQSAHPGKAAIVVVFVRPAGLPEAWSRTRLWQAARSLPAATVIDDEGGELARRFGASTSGSVLFYDPQGSLRFQGGLTRARGVEGANAGREAVLSLLAPGPAGPPTTPVFGCPLLDAPSP